MGMREVERRGAFRRLMEGLKRRVWIEVYIVDSRLSDFPEQSCDGKSDNL
jgi:hypothetical protein